jgi:hypothetical protein
VQKICIKCSYPRALTNKQIIRHHRIQLISMLLICSDLLSAHIILMLSAALRNSSYKNTNFSKLYVSMMVVFYYKRSIHFQHINLKKHLVHRLCKACHCVRKMKLSVCQTFSPASLHPMPFKGFGGEIQKNVSRRVTQSNSLPSESRFTLTPPRRDTIARRSHDARRSRRLNFKRAQLTFISERRHTKTSAAARDQKSVAAAAPFLLFLFCKAILLSPDSPALLH